MGGKESKRWRLTDDTLARGAVPNAGNRIYYDIPNKRGGDYVAGFGLRVTSAGHRSFILNYRTKSGRERRYTIGSPPAWSVTAARSEAGKLRAQIDVGNDPLAEAQSARGAVTFEDAFKEYIEHEAKGRKANASADDVQRAVLKHCTEWNARAAASIDAGEIGALLRKVRDGNKEKKIKARPYMANRLYSYLQTFFGWCAKPDVKKVLASPMIGMDKPWDGEEVRDRVFNDKEIKSIWGAADEIGGTAGAYVKSLLLLGKRKSAWAAAKWTELDEEWTWVPPADRRRQKKTKRLHGVPLPKLAQRVIAPLRPKANADGASEFIFPGRTKGTHLHPGGDIADDICKLSGVDDFFWHALRHTLETRAAELSIEPHIRDLILDHAPVRGAGKGYDHWHYRPQMLAALETWAAHVEKIVTSKGVAVLR